MTLNEDLPPSGPHRPGLTQWFNHSPEPAWPSSPGWARLSVAAPGSGVGAQAWPVAGRRPPGQREPGHQRPQPAKGEVDDRVVVADLDAGVEQPPGAPLVQLPEGGHGQPEGHGEDDDRRAVVPDRRVLGIGEQVDAGQDQIGHGCGRPGMTRWRASSIQTTVVYQRATPAKVARSRVAPKARSNGRGMPITRRTSRTSKNRRAASIGYHTRAATTLASVTARSRSASTPIGRRHSRLVMSSLLPPGATDDTARQRQGCRRRASGCRAAPATAEDPWRQPTPVPAATDADLAPRTRSAVVRRPEPPRPGDGGCCRSELCAPAGACGAWLAGTAAGPRRLGRPTARPVAHDRAAAGGLGPAADRARRAWPADG